MKKYTPLILLLLLVGCDFNTHQVSLRKILLQQLKNSHSQEEWFAPIDHATDGITAEQSAWHDSTDNHSIGQLVSHLAFWNERVLKSFQGNTVPDFKDNNRVTFKQLNEQEWLATKTRLDSIQLQIEQLVDKASEEQLQEWAPTINNLCMHNAYHTGQIIYVRKKNGWWQSK